MAKSKADEARDPKKVVNEFFGRIFVSDHFQKHNRMIVAIDPGAEGAIGLKYGPLVEVLDIPTIVVARGKGKKTEFNLPAIAGLFTEMDFLFQEWLNCTLKCILEQPPVSMGPNKGSAYGQARLMAAHAMWPLFLTVLGIPFEQVAPSAWKKKMHLPSDKETCRSKALGMFPNAPIQRVKDHNRAEALLLAEYYERTLGA